MLRSVKSWIRKYFRSGTQTIYPAGDLVKSVQNPGMQSDNLPFFPLDFTVQYLTTEQAVDSALAQILDGVRRQTPEEAALDGVIDLVGGSKKSAILALHVVESMQGRVPLNWDNMGLCVVQICRGNHVWVINLRKVRAYPKELKRILTSSDILKVGVGLLSDIPVFWRDLRSELRHMVDVGMMARLLMTAVASDEEFTGNPYVDGGFQNLSLQKCAAVILGFSVDKTEQVSDWSGDLTVEQIQYAATDAVVVLRLYERLVVSLKERAEFLRLDIPTVFLVVADCVPSVGPLLRSTSMLISSLPDSCLLECFKQYLGRSRADFVTFVRARHVACAVHRSWGRVLQGYAPFWNHVVLTQHVPPPCVKIWLDNAGMGSLTVDITLRGLDAYYRYGDPSARVCSYVRAILPLLLPSTGRWLGLSLDVEDSVCAQLLLIAFRNRAAPFLRHLHLNCPVAGSDALGMQSLVLVGQAVELSGLGCFSRLSRLDLVGHGVAPAQRLSELISILEKMYSLEHLTLQSLEVLGRYDPNATAVLHALRTLVVDFGASLGMGVFVASLAMPALSSVVLTMRSFDKLGFVTCLSYQPSIFSSVSSLTIRSGGHLSGSRLAALDIFGPFVSAVSLDLRDAGSWFLGALADPRVGGNAHGNRVVLLPKLRTVSVDATALLFLRAFLDARMGVIGCALNHLHIRMDPTHNSVVPNGLSTSDWTHIRLNVLTFTTFPVVEAVPARFSTREPELLY
ncbi:hypothetical protein C8F04DRAFT_1282321 [Mycena alexandri]|uniref:3'-5' exonuclease n=1 Tax=Mycena alexandri TaxID=1745969 RepID=A0AAD6WL03_9AGAR|nr:hypothetical protein C8F04DRAFT_1282321 [Mycena alexandri]